MTVYIFSVGIVIISLGLVYVDSSLSFSSNDNNHDPAMDFFRLSTKSPYRFHKQSLPEVLNFPGYQPKRVWGLVRHGTRFPGRKIISRYQNLTEYRDLLLKYNRKLHNHQVADFRAWEPFHIDLGQEKFLTKEGEIEMLELSKRLVKRFPGLFDYDSSKYIFKHTPTQRTEASSKYFIRGIFGSDSVESQVTDKADLILRPYKSCKKWRKEVKKNSATYFEKQKFRSSLFADKLLLQIQEKFQLPVEFEDVELFYSVCAYETAWFPEKVSPFCMFFDHQTMQVMEYLHDLTYYWRDGYGYEITRKLACKTIEDAIYRLDPNSNEPSKTFYFSHSGTFLKTLTFLGAYQDQSSLTANNFHLDRKWRTSNIDTFGSNLIFVIYESPIKEHFVLTLHQESILQIAGLKYNSYNMCQYEEFKEFFNNKIKSCDLATLCLVDQEIDKHPLIDEL